MAHLNLKSCNSEIIITTNNRKIIFPLYEDEYLDMIDAENEDLLQTIQEYFFVFCLHYEKYSLKSRDTWLLRKARFENNTRSTKLTMMNLRIASDFIFDILDWQIGNSNSFHDQLRTRTQMVEKERKDKNFHISSPMIGELPGLILSMIFCMIYRFKNKRQRKIENLI